MAREVMRLQKAGAALEQRITVHLTPRAGRDEIVSWDISSRVVVAKVSAQPENNKANIAMLKLLRKFFGRRAVLIGGRTSRTKRVEFV